MLNGPALSTILFCLLQAQTMVKVNFALVSALLLSRILIDVSSQLKCLDLLLFNITIILVLITMLNINTIDFSNTPKITCDVFPFKCKYVKFSWNNVLNKLFCLITSTWTFLWIFVLAELSCLYFCFCRYVKILMDLGSPLPFPLFLLLTK